MKRPKRILLIAGVAALVFAAVGLLWQTKKHRNTKEIPMNPNFHLTSPAFSPGGNIPAKYTCKGDNISPPLEFSGAPADTAGLAIVLHDPDAPSGDFLHWTIWDINAAVTIVAENTVPVGAVQGANDFGKVGYGGPCPPSGTHHYEFDAYALDSRLDLPAGANRQEVMSAIQAHAIARTKLTSTFSTE